MLKNIVICNIPPLNTLFMSDNFILLKRDFQLTNVVSLNSHSGEVYSIQHYVIKFVSDLGQVFGFLWVVRFLPPIKLTATI